MSIKIDIAKKTLKEHKKETQNPKSKFPPSMDLLEIKETPYKWNKSCTSLHMAMSY